MPLISVIPLPNGLPLAAVSTDGECRTFQCLKAQRRHQPEVADSADDQPREYPAHDASHHPHPEWQRIQDERQGGEDRFTAVPPQW